MNSWTVPLILIGIAIALWIAADLADDPEQHEQEEFEELSLNLLQELHQMKQRVEMLETELDIEPTLPSTKKRILDITKRHVLTLYTKGVPTEQITQQINIPETAVLEIIDTYISEGL